MLYQLSHFRPLDFDHPNGGAESQNRTGDTAIFSRVLYQLSYLGPMANQALAARRRREDYHAPRSASKPATGQDDPHQSVARNVLARRSWVDTWAES